MCKMAMEKHAKIISSITLFSADNGALLSTEVDPSLMTLIGAWIVHRETASCNWASPVLRTKTKKINGSQKQSSRIHTVHEELSCDSQGLFYGGAHGHILCTPIFCR